MVSHTFNPSTYEEEAGEYLSLMSPWSTEVGPEQPGLTEKSCFNNQSNNNNNKNKIKKIYLCMEETSQKEKNPT